MRFKEIKTYQSVRFGKGEDNFYSIGKRGQEDLVMEEVSWGIRVKSKVISDDIIISFNNIAYAKALDAKDAKVPDEVETVKPKKADK